MLLLIDTSGSMDEEIGSGSAEIKLEAAKQAAIAAVDRATASGTAEVAVLAFEGGCHAPVSRYIEFTTDVDRLTRFIDSLQTGGGTPMAEAVLFANRFMRDHGDPAANSQMIVLLADGGNDCGDVAQAMAELQAAGIVFRHETVGFGIEPASEAASELRHVATASGGEYHHAASATQLADVFMEFVDTMTVIDLLGSFGIGTSRDASSASPPAGSTPDSTAQSTPGRDSDTGSVTDLIGTFTVEDPKETAGALAIDTDKGAAWGWAAGYPTVGEAEREALAECGAGCRIVVTFEEGCAAYAVDRSPGRSVAAWASDFESRIEATEAALAECARQGGTDCIVRVWACEDGTGGAVSGSATGGPVPGADDDQAGRRETAGALAIDSGQGEAWGWAAGHATVAQAEREALAGCGDECQIVVRFDFGCASYAADQTPGSTVFGWATEFESRIEAADAALAECARRGGEDCLVRVWACGNGTGNGASGRASAVRSPGGGDDQDGRDETAGALAIDSPQGEAWGWGAGYATVAEAEREALARCGEECQVVVRFEEGCAAYAADQTPGSTVVAPASGFDSGFDATAVALDQCARRGGEDCLVRVWACDNGTGNGASGRGSAGRSPDTGDDQDGRDETAGALAIDSPQGEAWAWAAGYATVAEAEREALAGCGEECRIVVKFEEGCAAYAADQTPGSTVVAPASGFDSGFDATEAALDECARRGGADCLVLVWACDDGTGLEPEE
ncbi:MAG: DUF4189 domain-containing protein [Spirochaetaceae bacterium]|nr:DUF4189 domain-containing protein [Spirochaetaceae bacterium]